MPDAAASAQRRFAELKKDAKTFAVRQAARLEKAMVSGAPLVGGGVSGGVHRASAAAVAGAAFGVGRVRRRRSCLRAAFRIAEDGTLADVADEHFEFGPDMAAGRGGAIGVVHPVQLAAELPRWAEICHDYEIIQPFPQVGRPVFALTEPRNASSTAWTASATRNCRPTASWPCTAAPAGAARHSGTPAAPWRQAGACRDTGS